METKAKRRHLKVGQVWKLPVYTSRQMDNELVGYAYYVIKAKNSDNIWKIKVIKKDPDNVRVPCWWTQDCWCNSSFILENMTQEDSEEFKTAVVLFG